MRRKRERKHRVRGEGMGRRCARGRNKYLRNERKHRDELKGKQGKRRKETHREEKKGKAERMRERNIKGEERHGGSREITLEL